MISVCIATYNGEKYIKEQIASILPQLSEDDEVIVSDDESTDNTLKIIGEFHDNRIKIFHHKKKKKNFIIDYSTRNFEYALKYAHGDYIFLSDQDDVWLPSKVKKMVADLRKGYLLTICDCKTCTEGLKVYQESFFEANKSSLRIADIITHFRMMGCCMAMRCELLNIALPFPKTKVGHDLWLTLIAQYLGKAHILREPLHLYRRHSHTVSYAGKRTTYSVPFKIYYHLFILFAFMNKVLAINIGKISNRYAIK